MDTEPPSDDGLDQGNSLERTNEVERRSKVAMVVDDDLDIKIEKGPPPPRELSQLPQEHDTYVFSHSTPDDFSPATNSERYGDSREVMMNDEDWEHFTADVEEVVRPAEVPK